MKQVSFFGIVFKQFQGLYAASKISKAQAATSFAVPPVILEEFSGKSGQLRAHFLAYYFYKIEISELGQTCATIGN